MTNTHNGTLYIGVTSDLKKRIYEHKNKLHPESFTSQYNINKLVYYEYTNNIESALQREKQLKNWTRKWKLDLIESTNPTWKELEL
jgi:putative endonuclease